ncbi:carbohydrate ABC transporter permease [Pseudonocardia sp. TRM90224]|uniref:carbohydrate ABC transporter permease n=1 Tax=Pseudonocardia sp. TRM90224 TaxID=2812678 RepID=UPI001E60E9B4|nr:carbohydrate ABC transporter permease [Pseudonocardia sp. TRM90224]
MSPKELVGRVGLYVLISLITVFMALPVLWLLFAPFDASPTLSTSLPDWTGRNFGELLRNPDALPSIGISLVHALGTMALVTSFGALAAYALSRVKIPGRDGLLYALLLLSSIITGTAAMVPIFTLMTQIGLVDTQLGVVLVLTGGMLPTAIFILKDFMDGIPRSYEESARVFGASPLQILRDVVLPVVRPGLATIAVWTVVQVWGNFLTPFILLRQAERPAAVVVYTFYTEGGQADLGLISAFSLLYSIPVVAMYVFVNRRYGFRFHGGIKR